LGKHSTGQALELGKRGRFAKVSGRFSKISFYSPSPEYPAACWSETEIPPSGAAGIFITERRLYE
jgi:hypothetical protein